MLRSKRNIRILLSQLLLPLAFVACDRTEYVSMYQVDQRTSGGHAEKELTNSEKSPSGGCQGDDNGFIADDRRVTEDTVVLKRHSQTVHRISKCTGDVISRGVEEVVKPSEGVSITADQILRSAVARTHANNRTTCSGTGLWNAFGNLFNLGKVARIDFTADIAKTTFNMQVKEGLNYIDYDFYGDCPVGDSECSREERVVLEKGTLVLDVIYEVKDLDAEGAEPKIIEEPCEKPKE